MLTLQNITYRIGGRVLIESGNMQVPLGHHVGLVGRNGAGKSTIFRLILNKTTPDGGTVDVAKDLKVLTVAQEVPGGAQSSLEFLLASDKERVDLLHAVETCEDPNLLADLYDRLIQIDAYSAEARASTILKGLGFSDEAQNQPLEGFSGGYRMRVALASVLFRQPDILLLDEPTNHLDLEASLWLKDYLKTYPKTLVIISHDRDFLNECVDTIFHLHQRTITRYKGNYDQFIEAYQQQKAFAEAFNAKVENQRKHLQSFVDRFRAKASKAAQAQSRMKALEKLTPISVLSDDPTINLSFPDVDELSPPVIHFDKVKLAYGDHVVLKNLSGSIGPEDRIALLGSNGNGKSTFAKFLAGHMDALSGVCTRHPKVRIAFFQQHQMDALNMQQTAVYHMMDVMKQWTETQARTYLGRFGFSRDKADVVAKNLSGGEKARLVFALMCTQKPHVIILDEPTNHLDMEMRESLMMAINDFKGAVILIAHDWHLLNHTVDRLWLVANQTVKPYQGSLNDYKREVLRG
jgi:ATP-binding cassette subfamily F protein 3